MWSTQYSNSLLAIIEFADLLNQDCATPSERIDELYITG